MRINEIILEDVSPEASMKNIVDILTIQLPQLYHRLTIMAEKMHDNRGDLVGWRLISSGQKSQWYHNVYFSNMKSALYNFAKSLPHKPRMELQAVLGNSDSTFGGVESVLLPALENVAKATKNSKLAAALNASNTASEKHYAVIEKLSIEEPEEPTAKQKAPKDPEQGKQYAAIEDIINDVLSRVDKTHAGEIRNILARSDNKLLVLRQELNKRNIKV